MFMRGTDTNSVVIFSLCPHLHGYFSKHFFFRLAVKKKNPHTHRQNFTVIQSTCNHMCRLSGDVQVKQRGDNRTSKHKDVLANQMRDK